MMIRIRSAVIMAVIAIPLLIVGGIPFALFASCLSSVALYELLHIRESKKEFPFLLKVFAYLMVLFFCLGNYQSTTFSYLLDYRVMSFLIFAFLLPMVFINDNKKYNLNDALFLIGSILFIGLSFNLFILVRNSDLSYFIYLLLITIVTDTFAFITGKYIGVHKLASKISPKKTVEGFFGGVFMGTFVASMFYYFVISSSISLITLILITFMLSVIGQLGDLVFSSIKRYYDKKDFSLLIPGHGGILDRLDSLIFVVLAFILCLSWI